MYTVYKFIGIYETKLNGSRVLNKMSLEKCFNDVFSTYYDANMKQFFERGYAFETVEKSIEEIYTDIKENNACFFPFSKDCEKNIIQNYFNLGLKNIYFLRAGEYNKMKKEYYNYI